MERHKQKLKDLQCVLSPSKVERAFKEMTDEVFKREELDGETYDRHMNPEKHEKDLNVYEILT